MKKLILVLSLFITANLSAQDSAAKKTGEIYRRWPHYKMDGKNLSNKKMKEEIYKVPAAIPYYQKANTNKIIALSCIAPMALFAFLGKQNTTTYPYKNNTGFSIASGISAVAAIIFITRYSKNLKKAIRLHNEQTATVY